MQKDKYKKLWISVGILSSAISVGVIIYIINLVLPQAYKGNPLALFFILLIGLIIICNFTSYFIYKILKISFPFPKELLIKQDEHIIIDSSVHEVITIIKGVKTGIAKLYITITNKRLIIAGNNLGFWSYKLMGHNIWFDSVHEDQAQYVLNVKVGKTNDSLLLTLKYRSLEVVVDNPESILKQIDKK